jgi:hypothetical protein
MDKNLCILFKYMLCIDVLEKFSGGVMALTTPSSNGQVKELTQQEGKALLDQAARRYLKMSADEFIQAWESGEFDDDPDRPDVMYVAMLLPLAK